MVLRKQQGKLTEAKVTKDRMKELESELLRQRNGAQRRGDQTRHRSQSPEVRGEQEAPLFIDERPERRTEVLENGNVGVKRAFKTKLLIHRVYKSDHQIQMLRVMALEQTGGARQTNWEEEHHRGIQMMKAVETRTPNSMAHERGPAV